MLHIDGRRLSSEHTDATKKKKKTKNEEEEEKEEASQSLRNSLLQQQSTSWTDSGARAVWGRGYITARTDTTQQSGQTPVKEVEIKNSTVYVSGYTETDTTGMLSPPRLSGLSV